MLGRSLERKRDTGLGRFPVHFQQGVSEKIDRPRCRKRINFQVTAAAEFKSIGRMVAKIVCREGRILVGFTDVHGPPLAIGIKLYPAMIAVYAAVVSLGGNAGSDRETRGNADRPGQGR